MNKHNNQKQSLKNEIRKDVHRHTLDVKPLLLLFDFGIITNDKRLTWDFKMNITAEHHLSVNMWNYMSLDH